MGAPERVPVGAEHVVASLVVATTPSSAHALATPATTRVREDGALSFFRPPTAGVEPYPTPSAAVGMSDVVESDIAPGVTR